MSETKQKNNFTISSVRGTRFPITIQNKFLEYLYKQEDAPFTIGDIVILCGLADALLCVSFLPKERLNAFMRRCVIPSIRRYSDVLLDKDIRECLEMTRNYFCKNKIDVDVLQTKATDLFEKSTSILPQKRLSNSYELVYLAARMVFDDHYHSLEQAANIMFIFDQMTHGNKHEREQQKLDLLMMFPPITQQYHKEQDVFWKEAIIRSKKNWVMKLLGFKRRDGKTYEFKWGSFAKRWGLELELIEFSSDDDCREHTWFFSVLFIFGRFWINLPTWFPRRMFGEPGQGRINQWGFSTGNGFGGNSITFSWAGHRKYVDFPWCPTHHRTERLMLDGTWQSDLKWDAVNPTREEFESQVAKEIHSYRYVLRSGEVQHRLATVHVSEREWRPKWTKRIPIFRNIRRCIEVEFSDEVGERSGSWKGGCVGCSCEMKPDESPREALRRMERDRRFE